MTHSRRDMLALCAASSILAACSKPASSPKNSVRPAAYHPSSAHPAPVRSTPVHDTFATAPIPAYPVSTVPEGHRQIALTIDDGVDSAVVEGYGQLCKKTGMRLTFFANGCYDSWKINRDLLAPMVESGQIVIGNHTLTHPDIRRTDIDFTHQIRGNEQVFSKLFGSSFSMRPYFRPPYGYYNKARLHQLRDMGYSCITMWMGTTGDDQNIPASTVMKNLDTWAQPGRIVIGHANHPGVLKDFDKIHELCESRKLTTVTIADVYPAHR